MNRIKRIISGVTAVTTILTLMTGVQAAPKYREHILLYSDSYRLKRNIRLSADSSVSAYTPWEFIFDGDGTPCYSLQAGKSAESSIKKNGYDAYTETDANLTAEQQSQLESILLYSYTDTPDSFGSANNINFDEFAPKYIATQLLVWETVNGQRTNYYKFNDDWMMHKREFKPISNGFRTSDDLIDCFENKDKGKKVRKYYEEYEEKIKADSKRITFAVDKDNVLTDKPINGRYEFIYYKNSISYETNYDSDIYEFSDQKHRNAGKYSSDKYTTDMNNVLDDFNIEVRNCKLLSRSRGNIRIQADFDKEAEIKFSNKSTDKCGTLFLGGKGDEAMIVYPKEKRREYYVYADGMKALDPPIAVTVLGDADCNGDVGLSDVICVSRYNVNHACYPLSEQGLINADVNHDRKVNGLDAAKLMEYNLQKIKEL